jgi:Kef-type K+ transport system membrane component KefB
MTISVSEAQSLFLIALGALIIPIVSRRLRMPSAVGELIYGIAFGPYLLNLIAKADFIEFMAHLGFAILMFSAGMEIDFAPLRKRGNRLLAVAAVWVVIVAAVAILGAYYLELGTWPTLAVCSVSIGLASVLLRERKLLGAPLGQAVLAAGLIGETLSILMLTVLEFYHEHQFSLEFLIATIKFIGIFGLAYFLMRAFRFIIWWYPKKVASFLESEDPLELGVRLAVALLFIFFAAAVALGVHAILGTFIAGALFGYIFQEREVIADKINAMGQGFFVPFFFIVVGTHFDPRAFFLGLSGDVFLKLLGLALTAKIIASLMFLRLGLKWSDVLAGGLLFSAPLTLTVVVAEVGHSVGAVDSDMQGTLILIAITTGLACPFLARMILRSPDEKIKGNTG